MRRRPPLATPAIARSMKAPDSAVPCACISSALTDSASPSAARTLVLGAQELRGAALYDSPMQVKPRYDGATLISIEGEPGDQLAPVVRQRRRLSEYLSSLSPQQWATPSRCDGWSVKDVVAHLAGVNSYWVASIEAGIGGTPTRWLDGFDPVATPEAMVAGTRHQDVAEVHASFADSNEKLVTLMERLDFNDWSMSAEAPPGHLPVRLVASHALWDAWVHERDIMVPLGASPRVEDDEVASSLRYVVALSAAFGVLAGRGDVGQLSLVASNPDVECLIVVSGTVEVRNTRADASAPVLSGDAVELLEALSFRSDLPDNLPPVWRSVARGLATAFDSDLL